MLIDLHRPDTSKSTIKVKDIDSPAPFPAGIEYSCPARGNWTIAHSPMLVPGGHMIYIGASACLRGVVLSAAEYEGLDRFSMVMVEDKDILSGDMEELMIEGITDILNKLPYTPNCVMPFSGCIHHFMGVDFDYIYDELRSRFPEIDFVSCHMIPTMKKTDHTAEEMTRRLIYESIDPLPHDPKSINLIGSNELISKTSEYYKMLTDAGYTVRELADIYDYDSYKQMGVSFMNIYSMPVAKYVSEFLEEKLNQKPFYLPNSFDCDEIEAGLTALAGELGLDVPDFGKARESVAAALSRARDIIGDAPIAIDYLASTRYFGLAKLLVEHGFNVQRIYGDAIAADDMPACEWLKINAPDIDFIATVNFRGRFYERDGSDFLAIGQKAAYFTGTDHFVNMVENNGLHGFDGICQLADLMIDAYQNAKDVKPIISVKAWGCSA